MSVGAVVWGVIRKGLSDEAMCEQRPEGQKE